MYMDHGLLNKDMGCLIRHSYGLLYTTGHLKVGIHRTTGPARRIHQHRVHISSYQLQVIC
ncbi:hypothetical protein Hanom_Chr05g00423671 [Helianthus anomalus]